jgi:hypothetical protein
LIISTDIAQQNTPSNNSKTEAIGKELSPSIQASSVPGTAAKSYKPAAKRSAKCLNRESRLLSNSVSLPDVEDKIVSRVPARELTIRLGVFREPSDLLVKEIPSASQDIVGKADLFTV